MKEYRHFSGAFSVMQSLSEEGWEVTHIEKIGPVTEYVYPGAYSYRGADGFNVEYVGVSCVLERSRTEDR